MTHMIGISGKMGSGKDTVAEIIAGDGFQVMKFADSLKEIVSIITGAGYPFQGTEKEMREWKSLRMEKYDKSMGEMLQIVGTAIRQNVHPDVWIDVVLRKAEQNPIVVADVRYRNEADAIKKHGGVLIRLERPESKRLGVLQGDTRKLAHQSETELDDYASFGYVINNNGTIGDLRRKVHKILLLSTMSNPSQEAKKDRREAQT